MALTLERAARPPEPPTAVTPRTLRTATKKPCRAPPRESPARLRKRTSGTYYRRATPSARAAAATAAVTAGATRSSNGDGMT
ncbi:hypothetical protein GCM10010388_54130 [Streptomyces mauvecolor]